MLRPGLKQGTLVGLAAVVLAVLVAQVAAAGGADQGRIASLQRQLDALRIQLSDAARTAKKKGKRGPPGPAGPAGAAGSARAFGLVSSDGTLVAAESKNLTVTKITSQQGAYCVRPAAGSGIDPTGVRPVVSADLASGVGSTHLAQISSETFYPAQCPVTAGWEVYTQIGSTGSFTAGDTGFSIVVP